MAGTIDVAELEALRGSEVGRSRWFTLDQPRIDAFAGITEDDYFIHTDPDRAAAESPFGGTIAHGFLTLSLLSAMAYDALPTVRGRRWQVNYGFDRIRFVAPVPSGARVRGIFALVALTRDAPDQISLRHAVTVEIENAPRPAIAAEWLTRIWGDFDGAPA
ncbi:MAG: MaoC family dehydratase [Alphaproteobacteria bacterium]|nr:MAG: MaoC family dehydratase [Alphaproteobacteria bacterium]